MPPLSEAQILAKLDRNKRIELSAAFDSVTAQPAGELPRNLNANGAVVVRTGPGTLSRIIIGVKGADGNRCIVYRNNTNSIADKVFEFDTTERTGAIEFNMEFYKGLTLELVGGTPAYILAMYQPETASLAGGMWPGLNFNYKSIAKTDEDIKFYRRIGRKSVRMHIPFAPIAGWTPTANNNHEWRDNAKKWRDAGFYVIFGLSWNTVNTAQMQAYRDAVVAEAAYCQANSICDEFTIGNEFETHITDGTPSLTIRDWVRTTLANDVKAVFTGKVVYAVEASYDGATSGSLMWATEGKGSLDLISLNTYGAWIGELRYSPGYRLAIPPMISKFGVNGWYISEFNVDGGSGFDIMPDHRRVRELASFIQYMREKRVSRAYMFQDRGFKDSDSNNQFQMRYSDGSFRGLWRVLVDG